MLDFLRKRAQSLVIQAIVVVIALVFIFWGVGTNLMNRQEAAIVVEGEEINFQQFQQAYDQAYSRLADQFGGTVPKGLAESLNIRQQVINQLTQEALLRQGGEEMGLRVGNEEVQDEIEDMIQFQEDGAFSIERYRTILAANRLSPEKYEQSLRYELLASKTVDSIAAFAETVSDYEIEQLYAMERETVQVSFVVISPDNYLDQITVDDEELRQWYADNGESYLSEKQVRLTYLPYTFEDVGARITVSDDEIAGYYDEHLTEFQTPERRRARHILFRADPDDPEDVHASKRALAAEVLGRARAGEDFAALAEQYSEGPSAAAGGDLGFFPKGQMVAPFDEAVFAMREGDISDPVRTDFGYHIIKLEAIEIGGITPLEQAAEDIAATLRLEQAKPMARQLVNEAYEQIIAAGSLEAYLDGAPAAVVAETRFFSRSDPPPGMTSDPAFLEKAFALQEQELSSVVETETGFAIISATAIREPQVPPLAEVREEAEADFVFARAAEQARLEAEAIRTELAADGASFSTVADQRGLRLQSSGKLLKNDPDHQSAFPEALVPQAFRLSTADPVPAEPGLVDQDFYVFQLERRDPPAEPMSDEERQRYREMLVQFNRQQVLNAWLMNRQAEADIRFHRSLEDF